ncbi:amidohydrolase family protein [Cohnella hashimotonis]|uniref:Amidohydrolase family protein n=1 Tax=Cohnella hashimotonis TaxID=2826895 RepID=A0ABT6TAF1_9BACL|nr:amidohydrolase family protein [Cohnella hashimotonis]
MKQDRINGIRIGEELFDITLDAESGTIASLTLANGSSYEKSESAMDANGLMYLPTLKDWHLHLDKHFLGEPWKPLQPFLDLPDQLRFEKSLLHALPTTAAERARRLLNRLLEMGTTSIRTHVDVDPEIGLRHLEDVLQIREEFRGIFDIEVVAFPQQGLLRSNSLSVMREAMRSGADLIGGVDPAGLDREVDISLEAMFELSAEYDAGVDLHLHDPGHLGLYTIERFIDLTVASGKRGRTAVSHAYCLGQVGEAESLEIAHKLREADVAIITSVPIDSSMPRVDQLLQAGVRVGVGCDNILDAWSPFGNGDLLARGSRLAEKLRWRTNQELLLAYPLITAAPLRPRVGDRADFMLVDAMNPMHALSSAPKREAVFAGGKLVGGSWHQDGAIPLPRAQVGS